MGFGGEPLEWVGGFYQNHNFENTSVCVSVFLCVGHTLELMENAKGRLNGRQHCPSPPSLQFRQFFQILKTTFCAYDRKNCDDVCNDNYDGKDGNFDNNGDKNY